VRGCSEVIYAHSIRGLSTYCESTIVKIPIASYINDSQAQIYIGEEESYIYNLKEET